MKLKFISEFDQIETNRQKWDFAAQGTPFSRWNWIANWFRHLGGNLKLAVLVAIDENDNWIGIAPMCVDAFSSPLTRKLRFLGSGSACSDYVDLICADDIYQKFSEMAVNWIVDNTGNPNTLGRIDAVELEGITTTSQQTKYLCDLFESHGLKSHTSDLEGGWVVDLPSTWAELNSTFSKSMRRKTKKASWRLASESTQVISSVDRPFEELWPIFTHLHQQRREMLGQPGCFANSDFEAFLKSATQSLIDESRAELVSIYTEGQPLASMLLLNDEHSVFMYQSGMDTQRMNLEPGYQVGVCAIERSINKGFKRFDFLRGDEPYKARWNTTRIPISRTRFVPRNPIANLKHGVWLTGKSLKNYLKPDSPQVDAN